MISICIPVHVTDSTQIQFFRETLESILKQKFIKYEVVVSDNTHNLEIQNLCSEFQRRGMNILYARFLYGSGLAQNLNHSVRISRGKIIKILFQDDYLIHDRVLILNRVRLLFSSRKWLVTGTIHFNQGEERFLNPFFPRPGNQLLQGINTISSPSVVMLPKKIFLPFLESLHFLVDCEWYVRMTHMFGKPTFVHSLHIVNRLHAKQSTHAVKDLLQLERGFALKIHSFQKFKKCRCICTTNTAL